jgi:hypothetical protein
MPDQRPSGPSLAPEAVTARVILEQLHGIVDPMSEQLAIAVDQVHADPDGSIREHARTPGPVPDGRHDLSTARARGVYLGR